MKTECEICHEPFEFDRDEYRNVETRLHGLVPVCDECLVEEYAPGSIYDLTRLRDGGFKVTVGDGFERISRRDGSIFCTVVSSESGNNSVFLVTTDVVFKKGDIYAFFKKKYLALITHPVKIATTEGKDLTIMAVG